MHEILWAHTLVPVHQAGGEVATRLLVTRERNGAAIWYTSHNLNECIFIDPDSSLAITVAVMLRLYPHVCEQLASEIVEQRHSILTLASKPVGTVNQ